MKNAISLIVMMIFLSCHVVGQDDAARPQRNSGNNNTDTDLFGGDQTKRVSVPNPFDVKTGEDYDYGEEMEMYGGEGMDMDMDMDMGGGGGMGMSPGPSPDELFRVGLQRAITALKKAKTNEEKSALKKHVQNAFDARYERTMVKRKKQLDQLKKQIGSLEKDLQRRAAAKARVVQLQVQSVELASEGLLELNELQGMPAPGGGGFGGMDAMGGGAAYDMGGDN